MARGINKVILVGNLGDDPEVRYGQSGGAVTNISVAVNEVWKDREGNTQERTEWMKVRFFGKLAEIAGEYLKKGRQVYVEGKLRTDKYQDKQTGQDRYITYVVGDEMQMLGGNPNGERGQQGGGDRGSQQRGGGQANRGGEKYGGREAPQQNRSNDPFPDDDIPF